MNIIGRICALFCIYAAMFADMSKVYPNIYAQGSNSGAMISLIVLLQRISALFADFSFTNTIILILIIAAYVLVRKYVKVKLSKLFCVLSGVLSVLYLFAESFYLTDSADYVLGDWFVACVFLMRAVGLSFLLILIFKLFVCVIKVLSSKEEGLKKLTVKYYQILLGIIICWIPQLILIYPGGYSNDVQDQLKQFFGYARFEDPHPPFITVIEGLCVSLGNALGNSSFGYFIYILIHAFFMAAGIAYCIYFVSKHIRNKYLVLAGVLIAGFLPDISYYATVANRDATYSVCLLVMSVCVWAFIEDEDTLKHSILFSVYSLLASLTRHNGIYVTAVLLIVLLIVGLKNKMLKKTNIRNAGICLIGVVCFFIVVEVIYPLAGVEKGMDHLIYTNLLQGTARIALENPEEITEEDRAVIEGVIDFDKIEEYFNPRTSDGIKPIVYLDAPDENVKAYYKVWFKEFKKHPLILLNNSFNVSYGFWSPVAQNEENVFDDYFYASEYPEFNLSIPGKLIGFRKVYAQLVATYTSLPLVEMLQNPGFNFYLMLTMIVYLLYRKKSKYMLCFVPGMVTAVFYTGIPAYYHHPRYSFPIVYGMFLYFVLCIWSGKENISEKKECD